MIFVMIVGKGTMGRFDIVVSNPPYQVERRKNSMSRRVPFDIFPDFQVLASRIGERTSMIYPATWQKYLTDVLPQHLLLNGMYRSDYFVSDDMFPSITKRFPLSIVNTSKDHNGRILVNGSERPRESVVWLDSDKKALLYDLTKRYERKFSGMLGMSRIKNLENSGLQFSDTPNNLKNPVSLYTKQSQGIQSDMVTVYVERDSLKPVMKNMDMINGYKVSIRTRVVGRTHIFNDLLFRGKILGARIFGPNQIHSITWGCLKQVDTLEEAENVRDYMNTDFFITLTAFDYSRVGFARFVPDLQDYTNNNPIFQTDEELGGRHEYYGLSLDERLVKLFSS